MAKRAILCLFLVLSSFHISAMERFYENGWLQSTDSVRNYIQYPQLVDQIYQNHQDQLIWLDKAVMDKFMRQLTLIRDAKFSPLFERQLTQMNSYREQQSVYEFDLLATDTLLLYISYSENVGRQGMTWFFNSKLSRAPSEPSKSALLSLNEALIEGDIMPVLDRNIPSNKNYLNLIQAYENMLSSGIIYDTTELYQQSGKKKVGDILTHRDTLIKRLALVDLDISSIRTDVNNVYDHSLETVVKAFQEMHGLAVDGVIGARTVAWLNVSPTKRLSLLALNAERSRAWPEFEDTNIIVNLPSFNMSYTYNGEELFNAKVVVGREARKTPIMKTTLYSVVLNPTWNIPRTIMVEDIIPKVKRDPEYLTRQRIEIMANWTSSEVINPSQIDWATINPKSFPYHMRQKSGSGNSLGFYKFNTPNDQAIYLHDTPSKGLFNKSSRAYSSGCIRVQGADKFAQVLLKSNRINTGLIAAKKGVSNASISLNNRIPVHLIYNTAWYENGKLHYRDDIYGYDKVM